MAKTNGQIFMPGSEKVDVYVEQVLPKLERPQTDRIFPFIIIF